MDETNAEPAYSILTAVLEGGGPLSFLRRVQNLRKEKPELGHLDAQAFLCSSYDAARGRMLAASLAQQNVNFTTIFDPAYPRLLLNIPDPPAVLFYSGELSNLHRPCIGIVGSRACTTYGRQTARLLAGQLAAMGFVVVSGLALGIDAQAHDASLEVAGRTAAVLGSGPDVIYPKSHRDLARRIVRGSGIVLSEFPPGSPPKPFHFPIRNRIISGLCHATVVVEATESSGSLTTARHCLDQGRDLFAVPGPIHAPTSHGANRLIHRGEARLLLSVASILEDLEPLLEQAVKHNLHKKATIKDPLALKIYDTLDAFVPSDVDRLVRELEMDIGLLAAKLLELEAMNMIERKPGQLYVRNPLTPMSQ